jgi:hypothetical protein
VDSGNEHEATCKLVRFDPLIYAFYCKTSGANAESTVLVFHNVWNKRDYSYK